MRTDVKPVMAKYSSSQVSSNNHKHLLKPFLSGEEGTERILGHRRGGEVLRQRACQSLIKYMPSRVFL